jgi:hypothetical protein
VSITVWFGNWNGDFRGSTVVIGLLVFGWLCYCKGHAAALHSLFGPEPPPVPRPPRRRSRFLESFGRWWHQSP